MVNATISARNRCCISTYSCDNCLYAHQSKSFDETSNIFTTMSQSWKLLVAAELGVQRGYFASHMLANWPSCTKYYLIDVWKKLSNYFDEANVEIDLQEKMFEETKETLQPWAHKTTFLRMLTSEAVNYIDDNMLDFVHVDARHDFCGCKNDIDLYWPKIRPGSILAGHDFLYAHEVTDGQNWAVCGDGSNNSGAVRDAVEDFAKLNNLQIVTTWQDSWETWIIRKPE
jgi:predicted O-methyltransferase YrrM